MNKLSLWLFNLRYGFKHGFDIAEYSRYFEYPLVFKELQCTSKQHRQEQIGQSPIQHQQQPMRRDGFEPSLNLELLDIGSGRFGKFPLYVSSHSDCVVHSIDASPYVKEQYRFAKKLGLAGKIGKTLFIAQADATKLPYRSQSFDRVSSISVIEHIPDTGDLKAIREMARVMKKDGILVLTFPFNPLKDDEKAYLFATDSRFFKSGTSFYGRQSTTERIFFAKTYNERMLNELIKASGLTIVKKIYFGEPGFPLSRLLYDNNSRMFNFILKYCFGIFTPILTKLFFKEMPITKFQNNDWQGVGICIVLKKK